MSDKKELRPNPITQYDIDHPATAELRRQLDVFFAEKKIKQLDGPSAAIVKVDVPQGAITLEYTCFCFGATPNYNTDTIALNENVVAVINGMFAEFKDHVDKSNPQVAYVIWRWRPEIYRHKRTFAGYCRYLATVSDSIAKRLAAQRAYQDKYPECGDLYEAEREQRRRK